ncbi:MAG: formate dehydrogenase accessory sulfurtransferase FdhD [Acidimicrobiia bacterium]|nr:formate dehydrogenase accessory sulfurtransferase FdhD [Acidimicrobiia bacterium]
MPESRPDGVGRVEYVDYRDGSVHPVSGVVIQERPVCIFVNGRELATLLCTPRDLEDLAIGFAFSEGVVDRFEDIEVMSVSAGLTCVDLWLGDRDFEPSNRRIITSGCGGGITFEDTETLLARCEPLEPGVRIAPSEISRLMGEVLRSADLYNTARGVHTSALSDGDSLVLVAQDIGRHNTIDRLAGRALRDGVATEGKTMLTSGRISSEMLVKAARMRTPVVISRTSPTSLSVELAAAWNVTLIGYARGANFRVYSAPERIDFESG